MTTIPRRQVCQLCRQDELSVEKEGVGLWLFTCADASHESPHTWLSTGSGPLDDSGHDGISRRLGIYDDLLTCFRKDEPFLEYGVIEYRYAKQNPVAYRELYRLYEHTALRHHSMPGYSLSAFLGSTLGRLYREGLLVRTSLKCTGYWVFDGRLNGYALAPGPAEKSSITWKAFAEAHGENPKKWPTEFFGV